jgi:hypothetical protein
MKIVRSALAAQLRFVAFAFLMVSVSSALPAQESGPAFSWDRVPLYAHVGLGRGLKPEEYQFLAEHYDFIAFTGGALDRDYRTDKSVSFEPIATDAAKTIKQHNPNAKVLFYLASDFAKPHNKLSNATIPKDGLIKVRRNGKKTVDVFDTTNQATRDWWTDVAAKAVHEYGCDGIFVDGATAYTPGSLYERRLGKEKNAALEKGMFDMLAEAKRKMGEGSIILMNPLHGPKPGEKTEQALGWRYLPHVDGAMVDDFDRAANILDKRQSKEYIVSTIGVMAKAAKRGEIVIFKAWPGFTWWSDPELMKKPHDEQLAVSVKNLEFPLACFLIGAEEHCYFCYTWGWLPEHGALDWYPEFDKPLGPPKGSAVRDGWTFRREFEHASVFVDVEKRVGRIDWE